jgi:SAM-dependent methyltransferase
VVALDRKTDELAELGALGELEFFQVDLEDGSPWPLAERRFDAIVVTNYLHRPLFPQLLAALAEGGLLIYETFARGNEAYGRPRNPDFLLERDELLELTRGLYVLAFEQGIVQVPRPAAVQRICARRGDSLPELP